MAPINTNYDFMDAIDVTDLVRVTTRNSLANCPVWMVKRGDRDDVTLKRIYRNIVYDKTTMLIPYDDITIATGGN